MYTHECEVDQKLINYVSYFYTLLNRGNAQERILIIIYRLYNYSSVTESFTYVLICSFMVYYWLSYFENISRIVVRNRM